MDRVIDPEADVEHREGDGDEVERADGGGGEPRRAGQSHEKRPEGGEHEAPASEPGDQHHRDHRQGERAGDSGSARGALQLFVFEGRAARHPDPHAVAGGEPERAREGARAFDDRPRRQQLAVVELRLDDDEAPRRRRRAHVTREQVPPGDFEEPPLALGIRRIRDRIEHRREIDAAPIRPGGGGRPLQQLREARRIRLRGKRSEKRLCLGERRREGVELVRREVEECVALEERQRVGPDRPLDQGRLGFERGGEDPARPIREVRRLPVGHDQQRIDELRERLLELDPGLPPFGIRRDHPGGVGVEPEVAARVETARERERRRRREHQAGTAARGGDPCRRYVREVHRRNRSTRPADFKPGNSSISIFAPIIGPAAAPTGTLPGGVSVIGGSGP